MPEDQNNQQPENGQNPAQQEKPESTENGGRFESDTQKIVRRHLENESDVITDEDIRNVRVGMSPPTFDEATEVRFESEEAKDKAETDYLGPQEDESENDDSTKGKKITPWDTLNPE
jgi:hypothetical protein